MTIKNLNLSCQVHLVLALSLIIDSQDNDIDNMALRTTKEAYITDFLKSCNHVAIDDMANGSIAFFIAYDLENDAYYIVAKDSNDYVKWFSRWGMEIPEADICFDEEYFLTYYEKR